MTGWPKGMVFTEPATFFITDGPSAPWGPSLLRQTQRVKVLEICFSSFFFSDTVYLIAYEPFGASFLVHRNVCL